MSWSKRTFNETCVFAGGFWVCKVVCGSVMNHEHKITHIICIAASMFFVCLYFILFSYKYFLDTCRIYLY